MAEEANQPLLCSANLLERKGKGRLTFFYKSPINLWVSIANYWSWESRVFVLERNFRIEQNTMERTSMPRVDAGDRSSMRLEGCRRRRRRGSWRRCWGYWRVNPTGRHARKGWLETVAWWVDLGAAGVVEECQSVCGEVGGMISGPFRLGSFWAQGRWFRKWCLQDWGINWLVRGGVRGRGEGARMNILRVFSLYLSCRSYIQSTTYITA